MILTNPSKLIESFPNRENEIQQLTEICQEFESPELINEGNTTAPSKRIIDLIPEYEGEKVVAAPLTARKIGIAKIREKCPHFNDWIGQLESLSST